MEYKEILHHGTYQTPVYITRPDDHPVAQVVLSVHGFGGSAHDVIQTGIAEEMAMFYDATVRFDFPAHGENPMQELCLADCQQTLLAVAEHARKTFPEVEDLCLFASGFGAYVTLSVMDQLLELAGDFRLVVQTPSVLMHSALLSMMRMSEQTFRVVDRVTLPVPGRELTVTYRFYKELLQTIVMNPQPIPMLILHGEADDYIPMDAILNFRRINEHSKLVIIPGATHQFREEGAWDMVLDLTRDWFAFQQVMLCDWE